MPGWRDLEPGQIDKIEVYPADAIGDVLFRITTADGDVTTGTAHLRGDGATGGESRPSTSRLTTS